MRIDILAHAKINLFLQVGQKRPDGFHNIESLMQSISLADSVTLRSHEDIRIRCDDPELDNNENLAYRIAIKIAAMYPRKATGVLIDISKKIPVGAGLAGGSADAAAVIVGLNRLWHLELRPDELLDIGAGLGSDIPFSITGGTCWVGGRGEKIVKLADIDDRIFVLGISPFTISTAQAYSWIDDDGASNIESEWRQAKALAAASKWQELFALTANTFVEPVFTRFGSLREAIEGLSGLPLDAATLSGSGPTLVAVCCSRETALAVSDIWESLGLKAQICISSKNSIEFAQ